MNTSRSYKPGIYPTKVFGAIGLVTTGQMALNNYSDPLEAGDSEPPIGARDPEPPIGK